MEDLSQCAPLGEIITELYDAGRVATAVCHGPAGLLPASRQDGSWLFQKPADDGVHQQSGVKAVANEIESGCPVPPSRTDPDIALEVSRALAWKALVPADQVQVTISRGAVTLRGEVDWEYERRAAERAVRRLSGVRDVINLIKVRPRRDRGQKSYHCGTITASRSRLRTRRSCSRVLYVALRIASSLSRLEPIAPATIPMEAVNHTISR